MKKLNTLFSVLFVLYLLLLLFFSLYSFRGSSITLPKLIWGIATDKVFHFIMFFPLPISGWLALSPYLKRRFGKYALLALFIIGIAIASTTELLQSFTPFRESDIYDLIANYLAIIVATLLVLLLEKSLFKLLKI